MGVENEECLVLCISSKMEFFASLNPTIYTRREGKGKERKSSDIYKTIQVERGSNFF